MKIIVEITHYFEDNTLKGHYLSVDENKILPLIFDQRKVFYRNAGIKRLVFFFPKSLTDIKIERVKRGKKTFSINGVFFENKDFKKFIKERMFCGNN